MMALKQIDRVLSPIPRRRQIMEARARLLRSTPQIIERLQSRLLFADIGAGTGLAATYFDNSDFTGPSVSRVDATVSFDWKDGSPTVEIEPDTYSTRWTGQVQPRYSETYTFYTTGDDGMRLWVNGEQLVDDWKRHSATVRSGQVTLAANTKYDIRMEYYENYGLAVAKLEWSSLSQAREIIPTSQLFVGGSSPPRRHRHRFIGEVLRQLRLHRRLHHPGGPDCQLQLAGRIARGGD
jgi:hypothetical protein